MKTDYTVYICVCILYLLLSIINKIYPIGEFLLNIMYISTWGTLLLIEIRKILVIKRKEGERQSIDYFSIVFIVLVMIVVLVDI